jgi:uncharacterized protein YuzE
MRVDVSKRAIAFIRSDAPVVRTIANGDGLLLDFDEHGDVVALEVHEITAKGLAEFVAEHGLEDFMDEIAQELDNMYRQSLSRRQNRRLNEVAGRFRQHVAA